MYMLDVLCLSCISIMGWYGGTFSWLAAVGPDFIYLFRQKSLAMGSTRKARCVSHYPARTEAQFSDNVFPSSPVSR